MKKQMKQVLCISISCLMLVAAITVTPTAPTVSYEENYSITEYSRQRKVDEPDDPDKERP